jgi:hypothetical protein
MSWALRDAASTDAAISSRRLPSPTAATSHDLNRMMNLRTLHRTVEI